MTAGSRSAWQQRHRDWITDPILYAIYMARAMFNFQPVMGDSELARNLDAIALLRGGDSRAQVNPSSWANTISGC